MATEQTKLPIGTDPESAKESVSKDYNMEGVQSNPAGLAANEPIPKQTTKPQAGPSYLIYGGFINEQERDQKLTNRGKWRTFQNLLNRVPIIESSFNRIMDYVGNSDFELMPADGSDEAARIKEEMETIIFNENSYNFRAVYRHIASYIFYGFSLAEWHPINIDGQIRVKDITNIDPATIWQWVLNKQDGTLDGFVQQDPTTNRYRPLNRNKLVYAVYDNVSGRPDGKGGLFRKVAEPGLRYINYIKKQMIAFERDLVGLPIMEAPLTEMVEEIKEGNPSYDRAKIKEEVKKQTAAQREFAENIRKDNPKAYLMLDSEPYRAEPGDNNQQNPAGTKKFDFRLLEGSGGPHDQINQTIMATERQIARVFGTEDQLLGETAGSRALAEPKLSSFRIRISGINRQVEQVLNMDVIKPFAEMNGINMELVPKFTATAPKEITPAEKVAIRNSLIQTRMLADPTDIESENAILAEADLPIHDKESINSINERQQMMDELNRPENSNDDK